MRKSVTVTVILICILAAFFPYQHVFAEEDPGPVLKEANIEITIDNKVYKVREEISVSNLNGQSISHDLKEITQNKVSNVTFESNKEELIPEIDEGKTLQKYTIQPNNESNKDVSYTIEYNVEKVGDEFEIPLFVPEYAAAGDDRDVNISFQAPEGTKIQKNSFPIVNKANQTQVEKDMTNIPAIAKYVYAKNPTSIHSFSIISFIALFSLFAILIGWAIVEMKRGGKK